MLKGFKTEAQKETISEKFSFNTSLIRDLFQHAKPFGRHEDPKNDNLGFGFLYYSIVRMLRPQHTLVIGSGFGFSVVCLALGIRDNQIREFEPVKPFWLNKLFP